MPIKHQFGHADANGAVTAAQALVLGAEHQAIGRNVLAAAAFCSGGFYPYKARRCKCLLSLHSRNC